MKVMHHLRIKDKFRIVIGLAPRRRSEREVKSYFFAQTFSYLGHGVWEGPMAFYFLLFFAPV